MGKTSASAVGAAGPPTPKPAPPSISKKNKNKLKRMAKVSKARVKMGKAPVALPSPIVVGQVKGATGDRAQGKRAHPKTDAQRQGNDNTKKKKVEHKDKKKGAPVQLSAEEEERKVVKKREKAEKAEQGRIRRAAADARNADADLQALLSSGRKDAKAYNALLSKYSVRKQLNFALKVFQAMKKNKVRPTVHTYTNVINACVRCGDIAKAEDFFSEMRQRGLEPNEITYTAYIKGLCQTEQLNEADICLRAMQEQGQSPNIRTYNTLLRGAMRWADGDKAAYWFQQMLQRSNQGDSDCVPDRSSYEYVIRTLCLTPRYKEALTHYKSMATAGIKPHATIYAALATALSLYGEMEEARTFVKEGIKVLSQGYGPFLPQHDTESKHRSSLLKFMKMRNREAKRDLEATQEYLQQVEQGSVPRHTGYMHDSDRVIFPLKQQVKPLERGSHFPAGPPLRLEVCSGLGEWLVTRARNDRDSNWIGLEIRTERVYSIWSKTIYENVDNVLVLGGEANAIFQSFITDGCLAEVYVNYPDPPIWEESSDCLLNAAFIRQVHRALQPQGAFIVVTDDKRYCETVVKALEGMGEVFKTALPSGESYSKELPAEYGSSWFHRLWTNGGRTDRHFIKWIKR